MVWPAICLSSFPFVNPQRQPSIHDDVQAIRIPAELPRDLAIAVAEMSNFAQESLHKKMTCRGRSAEITAWCRKISFSQEHARRLGEKPGQEGREILSVYILDWRVVRFIPGLIDMVDE